MHSVNPPGYGLKHHRKDSQNNVGIVLVAAGAGDNLQRLLARGTEAEGRESHMGLANESVGAKNGE